MPPKPAGKADIRSFFTSIASKSKTSNSDTKSPGSGSKDEEVSKRKKKPMVLADSSDSDGPFVSSKKSKKEDIVKIEKPADSVATKLRKTKTSIPETPLKPVDIGAVFGDKPIHRSKDGPEKRKRPVVEDHSDEEFKATLKQLDDEAEAPVTKKTKVLKTKKEETDKSPAKKDKTKSPVKDKTKSPVKETNSKSISSSPVKEKNAKSTTSSSSKHEKQISDKKKSTEEKSPAKSSPKKSKLDSSKHDEVKPKKSSRDDHKELDSNSNKTSPKASKKIKTNGTPIVIETPKKTSASNDDSIIESPSFDPLEKRKQQAANYRKFLSSHKEGAKNPGCKPVPEGAPGCLTGLTIVVTGVMESLQREEAEELVKKYGGKATKSVSKNTSYILSGDDAGPAKLSKAKDLNVPIISEDDFLNLIATRPAGQGLQSPAVKKQPPTPKGTRKTVETVQPEPATQTCSSSSSTTPTKKKSQPEPKKLDPKPSASSKKLEQVVGNNDASLPWVEKYKPTNLKQVIGMHGDRSIAKKLVFWLQHWYENRTKKTTRPSLWSTNDDGSFFKAALLSGPPGIGKTTTAHLAAKEVGYDLVEMNASDTRSKRLLHEHVTELLGSQSLASYAHGSAHIEGGRKRVLVMDEVDGMAGNEDRGGVQELIGLIKTSKIPIICVCNDRQHPKIRSLVNYCYDLKVSRPRIEQIRGAMMSVCFKEGISIKPEALDEIIQGCNQDVRQVLHHLSMLASDKTLSTEKAKLEANKSRKDLKLGPWEVVNKVFSAEQHRAMNIHDKMGLFFQDYSLGPLFVQENYIHVVPNAGKGSIHRTLDLLSLTAHSMSETDLIEKTIRSQNAWSLLPVEAIFASVVPGQLMEGFVSSKINFPSWLGKYSRTSKMDRLLQEIQSHMRLRISGSKQAVNLDYGPHILDAITYPLIKHLRNGVGPAVKVMEGYDLTREDLNSLVELNTWPDKPDPMAGITKDVKTNFTSTFNAAKHLTPYASVQVKKGRSKEADIPDELELDENGDGLADEEDEEEKEDPLLDAMIKVKKVNATKNRSNSDAKPVKKRTKKKV